MDSTMNSYSSKKPFWAMQPAEALSALNASETGLSKQEAEKRLAEFGKNQVSEAKTRRALHILVKQFTDSFIIVLVFAAIIAFFLGERLNALLIISIIFITGVLGFFQEYRAEKALRELKKMLVTKARVERNSEIIDIDSREIVVGDIVHLHVGDIIPADILLLKAENFSSNQSSLTGESVPVEKNTSSVDEKKHLPQELSNMALMGTSVSSGWGHGLVTATGEKTFFGKTASIMKKTEETSDFQNNMHKFSRLLLKLVFVITFFVFLSNAFLGRFWLDSFLFALALAVGITPEILPIVVTVSLSHAAFKMSKQKVITKRLVSVEDLGNMDILCCDKTGTLTEDELSLKKFVNLEGKQEEKIFLHGLLCNTATKKKGKKAFGNSLDRAIWNNPAAEKLKAHAEKFEILDENEFDFTRRRMSVLAKNEQGTFLVAKGASEAMLEASSHAMIKGTKTKITGGISEKIMLQVSEFENDGYSVIAVAEKETQKESSGIEDEKEMVFLGFLLFIDPPKKTVKEALETFKRLNVSVKILSGDSPLITKKICSEVGLQIAEEKIITGNELDSFYGEEFGEACLKYNVFSRITPEQKAKIVSALKKKGHIVGFLGDGINDAPALQTADIGISVDTATGIAKEAADIILLKKSLRVLASGIIEGRKTFANITKYILNTISANFGNMITIAASSLFLPFIPLLPSQILLNNFLSDIPMVTISTDNVDHKSLKKPRKWDLPLIKKFMIYFGLLSAFFDLALILILMFLLQASVGLFRTAWFVESALSEIVVTFAIRSSLPFFKSKPGKLLLVSSIATGFVVVSITFSAIGAALFEFEPMPLNVSILVACTLAAYFACAELAKGLFFRRLDKTIAGAKN